MRRRSRRPRRWRRSAATSHGRTGSEPAASIGDVQVRNRGTIGGSIAHADPGADQPGVMLALDARMVARGPNGARTIPAAEFFTELLTTALQPNEVLTEIRVPTLPAR